MQSMSKAMLSADWSEEWCSPCQCSGICGELCDLCSERQGTCTYPCAQGKGGLCQECWKRRRDRKAKATYKAKVEKQKQLEAQLRQLQEAQPAAQLTQPTAQLTQPTAQSTPQPSMQGLESNGFARLRDFCIEPVRLKKLTEEIKVTIGKLRLGGK